MKKFTFTIETLNDNGTGMTYKTKEEFLKEIGLMIDDCINNGGTYFDVQVDSDANCFCQEDEEEYTVLLYTEDGYVDDMTQFTNKDEAIEYAKSTGADEVVNDITGAIVYQK